MEYVLKKNTGHFVKINIKGNIKLTSNLSLADRFTYSDACNFIKNNIKKKDKKNFSIEQVDDEVKTEVVDDKTIFDGMSFDWENFCKTNTKVFSQLEEYKKALKDKLCEIESERTDIEHYMEFFDKLNAAQGYKAYKMFNDIRCRRRKIKDEILKVDILLDSSVEDFKKGRVVSRFNGIENRKYEPRILKELFDV